MMMRSLAVLCTLLAATGAMVTFNHSVVLDEFDFQGKSSVSVGTLCRDMCHIYASIEATPSNKAIANNLLIQTGKGFVSVGTVALQKDAKTGRKLPLELKNTGTLTITNTNANYASGVIVLYVVNQNADYFNIAEVYDADGLDRKPSYVRVITVLSAQPFSLKDKYYMSMKIDAKLTGFDALDSPDCALAYSLEWLPFPGFVMTVFGPIVSLIYDLRQYPYPAGELQGDAGMWSDTHTMEQTGFFNSAGWHGCNGKPAYQSSKYNPGMSQYLADTSGPQDVTYNVRTNANEENAVIVRNSDRVEIARFHDCDDSDTYQQIRDFHLEFAWTYQPGTHYLVRYNSTAMPIR